MDRTRDIVVSCLVIALAFGVQWSYRDFRPVADDLDHLAGVARVAAGEQSLASFANEAHGPHWLPLWKSWYYLQWKAAGLVPWRWHLVFTLFHIASALLLYRLLRTYLGSPWGAGLAALLWAGNAIGGWDNPLQWIASSHFLMATTWLLAAMLAVSHLNGSCDRLWLCVLAASIALTLTTMGTMVLAVAILPIQYLLTHGVPKSWNKVINYGLAWALPLLPVIVRQAQIARETVRKGTGYTSVHGASLWAAVSHYVIAIEHYVPAFHREVTSPTALGWLAALILMAGMLALRKRGFAITFPFLLLTAAMTLAACLGRGAMPAEEVVTWGRYHYLPALFWCVAIAAIADRLWTWGGKVAWVTTCLALLMVPLYVARQVSIARNVPFEHAGMVESLAARSDFLQYLSAISKQKGRVARLPEGKVFEDLKLSWTQYVFLSFGDDLPGVAFVPPEQIRPEDRQWLSQVQASYRLHRSGMPGLE